MIITASFLGCYSSESQLGAHLKAQNHITEPKSDTVKTNSPEWEGKYQAVIPCDQCDATLVELTLNEDFSYALSKNHINDDGYYPVASIGLFSVDTESPNLLRLDGAADYQTIEIHNHGVTLHGVPTQEGVKNIRLIKTS